MLRNTPGGDYSSVPSYLRSAIAGETSSQPQYNGALWHAILQYRLMSATMRHLHQEHSRMINVNDDDDDVAPCTEYHGIVTATSLS